MQTFPPSRRLRNPKEFKRVWSQAKRISSPCMTIFIRENNLDHPRLGLSLAKKNIRKATDRNRLKRVARETFRLHQAEIGGFDTIVVIYKGADRLAPAEQYRSLQALWEKLATQYPKSC
jgi:ribonuclease P protein component